jgi:hypothetical protein
MNEIDELSKLEVSGLPPLRPMLFDDLYQNVYKNLHLELGTGPVLYTLSPSYSVIHPSPNEKVSDFLARKEDVLDYLREAIIQNLALYSALLDKSSYFIEQNHFLVLARLRERESDGRKYEIKFYTHTPKDLLSHYEDKIYIGRDFIDLFNIKRKHMGVKDFIVSLKRQFESLLDRAQDRMKDPMDYTSFFQEIKESVLELQTESLLILQSLPPYPDLKTMSGKDLVEVNAQYRTVKHFLIELHDEVAEFENLLRFKKETEFVRYVTKFNKDLTNLISYFHIKINGLLTRKIYFYKNRQG